MKIKSIENNIRDLRYKHGNMSQQQLADKISCTRQTINAIESNKYSPSYLLVSKIANLFGVKPSDVISISF